MKHVKAVLAGVAAMSVFAAGLVQAASGAYVSSELGLNVASGVTMTGRSNDENSYCDEYLVGAGEVPATCPAPHQNLTDPWQDTFDGGLGILAGMAAGYSFRDHFPNRLLGGLRVELEYVYRDSQYGQSASPVFQASGVNAQKADGELSSVQERLGGIDSHNLFGNLYYDFFNNSRFTPYVGVGGGVSLTRIEWDSAWHRNIDPALITSGDGVLSGAVLETFRQRASGSTSRANTRLEDLLFGFQVLFGVDYLLTDAVSLGLKGRWAKYSEFRDRLIWNPLRGHPPNNRLDGSYPVFGEMSTDDLSFFGVSVNLKYHF